MAQTCPYCHNPRSGDMTRIPCSYCGQLVKPHSPSSRLVMRMTSAPLAVTPTHVLPSSAVRTRVMAATAKKNVVTKPHGALRLINFSAVLASFVTWAALLQYPINSYSNRTCAYRCAEVAPVVAGAAFLFFILPRKSFVRWFLGLGVMVFTGALLVVKPLLAPVLSAVYSYASDGSSSFTLEALSYSAETHMYYWIPGLALLVVSVMGLIAAVTKISKKLFG